MSDIADLDRQLATLRGESGASSSLADLAEAAAAANALTRLRDVLQQAAEEIQGNQGNKRAEYGYIADPDTPMVTQDFRRRVPTDTLAKGPITVTYHLNHAEHWRLVNDNTQREYRLTTDGSWVREH